jgi:hypothetical protein
MTTTGSTASRHFRRHRRLSLDERGRRRRDLTPVLYLFDILYLDGDVADVPLGDRRNRLTDVVSPTEHVDVAPIRDAEFVTYYGELSIHEVWAIHPPEAASFSSPRKGTQFRVCEEKAPPFRVGRMSIAACCRAPPFRGPMKSIFDPAGNQRKVGKMQDLRHSPNVPLVCLP